MGEDQSLHIFDSYPSQAWQTETGAWDGKPSKATVEESAGLGTQFSEMRDDQ